MRYAGVATPGAERAQNQDGPERLASLGPLPFPVEGNDMTDATWRLTGRAFGGRNPRHVQHGGLQRATAMRALGSVVYAARLLTDGTIKIGWTKHFDLRLHWLKGYAEQDVELLAFRIGDRDDEQAIHASLVEHRAQGREYYHPTPAVLTAVNTMREEIGLPPLAA